MIKKILLFSAALFSFYFVSGQLSVQKKPKTFNTWAYIKEPRGLQRGIMYGVGDSSIFLKNSIRDTLLSEYYYRNISLLKIRRTKNIARGAIIGGTIGAAGGIIAINTIPEGGLSFMTAPISSAFAFFFGALGVGSGILIGSIKDWIPISRKYSNFDKYRGNLMNYSYQKEDIPGVHIFDHRVYVETKFGFSFAGGEITSGIPDDDYTRMNKIGTSFNLDGGYRFNKNLGLNLVLVNNNFGVQHIDSMSWSAGAFILSPVVSLPVSQKFRFDFAPGIGWTGASLLSGEEFILNGNGLGLRFNGSFIYNYSKRWFTSLNGGYLFSKQHFKEGGSGKIQTIDIMLGIAFKFGRRNL